MRLDEFLANGLRLHAGDELIHNESGVIKIENEEQAEIYSKAGDLDENYTISKSIEMEESEMEFLEVTPEQELKESILMGEIMRSKLCKFETKVNQEIAKQKSELEILLEKLSGLSKPKVEQFIEGDCYALINKNNGVVYYTEYGDGKFWCANFHCNYMPDSELNNYEIKHMVEDK